MTFYWWPGFAVRMVAAALIDKEFEFDGASRGHKRLPPLSTLSGQPTRTRYCAGMHLKVGAGVKAAPGFRHRFLDFVAPPSSLRQIGWPVLSLLSYLAAGFANPLQMGLRSIPTRKCR